MRDRRNTNLSRSSTDSAVSSSPCSIPSSFNEKEKLYASAPSSDYPPVLVTGISRTGVTPRRITLIRGFTVLWGLVLLYACKCWLETSSTSIAATAGAQVQNPASPALPDEPAAVLVADPAGAPKWTISIPHSFTFPLAPRHYREMCSHGAMLRDGLTADSKRLSAKQWLHSKGIFDKDATFFDIREAEDVGALPATTDDMSGVCERSMTFVLESEETSFGQSLLLLWLSYGLAQKQGRAFFIDDSRWTWGRYESYFKPVPVPNCKRPPPQYIVPCPHSARHLVASSATAAYQFGADFQAAFQRITRHGFSSQRGLFALLQRGYEDLFAIAGDDAIYLSDRIEKLKEGASRDGRSVVGMHVRRGDRHPFEFQYSSDYLPLERFTSEARSLLARIHSREEDGVLLLASDDPDVIDSAELQQASSPLTPQRAQDRIELATKARLDQASPVQAVRVPGSAYVLHKEENVGWEGGFYSGLLQSLGGAKGDGTDVPNQALRMRELVGRAYLLDLAVLGHSDGVVCAVSSATCRVLAVILGWDAVRDGRWVNVDDGRSWSLDGHR